MLRMTTLQNRKLCTFAITILIFGTFLFSFNTYDIMDYSNFDEVLTFEENDMDNSSLGFNEIASSPGVLSGMMTGTWETRPLTKQEHDEIFAFLFNAHTRYSLPANYQRNDSLCGNVTYLESNKVRALCNPAGKTPCCFHNKCATKTAEECVCEDCYDMRNMKHAEYSTWIPSHPGCTYHEHTPQEACDILDGMDVAFVGDSLVRHVYTAMLLVVTGNMKDGAMDPDAPKDIKMNCRGMYMFTEKKCRLHLASSVSKCGGKVRLRNFYYYSSSFARGIKYVASTMKEKSLLFMGIGVHDDLKYRKVQKAFLQPTIERMQQTQTTWPRLLWAAHHAPGILKSPVYLSQTSGRVKHFNKAMKTFLYPLKIPIFDTYNITDGMMSFDGEHYGMGINIVKANLLLSYMKELSVKEKWKQYKLHSSLGDDTFCSMFWLPFMC